jgi:hypothetical protein
MYTKHLRMRRRRRRLPPHLQPHPGNSSATMRAEMPTTRLAMKEGMMAKLEMKGVMRGETRVLMLMLMLMRKMGMLSLMLLD